MGGSTSHKRRSRKGRYARRGPPAAASAGDHGVTGPRVLSYDDHAITAGVGFDMLSRAGWVAGTPLGARSAATPALSIPIPIVVRSGRAGIGASPPAFSTSPVGATSLAASPAPVPPGNERVCVFDPLRPRCRFNSSHVVPSLKALQKHETSCPANPHRTRARRGVPSLSVSAPTVSGPSAWLSHAGDDESEDDLEMLSSLSDSDLSDEDSDA